ncbi:MAG: hypothetical protein QNI84_15100 [Henriciella sp.]|nr:hypothetical protein [Henriciella sp.]
MSFRVAVSDGTKIVPFQELSISLPAPLAYLHTSYFEIHDGQKDCLIGLGLLVWDHLDEESILEAHRRMLEASESNLTKRSPIQVQRLTASDFLILDGNSTAAVAKLSGWDDIPCEVIE